MLGLPFRQTQLFAWFCLILDAVYSFEVLPYVHIDYAYYNRLAQCQAKCTEKYGTTASRRLLDGSTRQFFDTASEAYRMCELGCSHTRILSAKHARSLADAFKDGQEFWKGSGRDAGTSSSSPIEAVRVLCTNPVQSDRTGYLDNFEASVVIATKADFIAPVRYLVQWKQRTAGQKHADETGWITGSIENATLFKVDGMHPGVQYRFSVVAVSPSGRLGKAVHSEWVDVHPLGTPGASLGSHLAFRTQYNSEDSASAVLRWSTASASSSEGTSLAAVRHRIKSRLLSCRFQLAYSNETFNGTESFEMDESEGYLLRHLDFGASYNVSLSNGYFGKANSHGTHALAKQSTASGDFKSISCSQVFGVGSLECDPEPVESLRIDVDAENGTASVTWKHSTELPHILTYRLTYEAVASPEECGMEPVVKYLPARSTNVSFSLPNTTAPQCEYELELTNFDLLGREASFRKRFVYTPPARPDAPSSSGFDVVDNLWPIAIPLSVLVAMCVVLRFAGCWQKRFKRVAELSAKRPLAPEPV